MHEFPTIPEDLTEQGSAAIRTFVRETRAALREILADSPTDEELTLARELRTALNGLMLEADVLDDETAEVEAEAATEAEELSDESDDDEDGGGDDGDGDDPEEASADGGTTLVRTRVGVAAQTSTEPTRSSVFSDQVIAVDGVKGKNDGDAFDSWLDVSKALAVKANTLKPNTSEKFEVARVVGRFDESMRLGEKPIQNLRMFEREEILAALCAPLPPNYDLACMNTTRRPVRASLPNFSAPRGGVKIYPSPTLQDITTGVGIWTHEDDANPSAEKEECATIACATPVDYRWYGVYRCITIKNMLAMTFPELVEAYLNRLAAAFARLAEIQLLEAMATETDTITAHTLGYNASVSITSNILNYLALYREQQRWDDQEFDAWMPRWIVPALQADQVRRKNDSGNVLRVPTEADIRRVFTDAGVTPHFFLDSPSWATPIPALQVTGQLGWFPRNLEMIVAPRGKFALMDEGQLTIGVTGNNIYRDNESNKKNQFTMFWEGFEGIVNTDSCPAHLLVFDDLCFNGQQIADIVINCEGGDEVGAAST